MLAEIAEQNLVGAIADVGRHEIPQRALVHRPPLLDRSGRAAVVLDVHPAQPGLHRQVLLEQLGRREALRQHVGRVENQDHAPDD